MKEKKPMVKFYLAADLAFLMAKEGLSIGSSAGVRKAVQDGRIAATGRTVGGHGLHVWSEDGVREVLKGERRRLDLLRSLGAKNAKNAKPRKR